MTDDTILEALLRYDTNAPRYTSYPPANLFHKAESKKDIEAHWRASNARLPRNLSFYFHIPFCARRCLFCGCTSEVLAAPQVRDRYFEALFSEMDEKLPWIDASRPVTQVHFGGGTPTSVPFGYLEKLIGRLRERFTFAPHAEIAIECNPASITEERLRALAKIGFTRVSYGIQDFSPDVLKIIGREPSLLPVKDLLALSRDLHFSGINLDLIYGLPGQTEAHFSESIEKAIDAHPDRIALYSYAHLPALKANQRALDKYPRPDARHKLELFLDARRRFMQAGFTFVGMDHFVDPEDSLARALSDGKLHRNFQGYCTRETTGQVYAFGASAISQLDNAYTQNVHESLAYTDLQLLHKLTEIRCEPLTVETKILRDTIERLMCNRALRVSPEEKSVLGAGWERLCALEKDGLLTKVSDLEVRATELGSLVIRYLAMQLDPLMQNRTKPMFSRTI